MRDEDFYILSIVVGDELGWDKRVLVTGTKERIGSVVDLKKLPYGTVLLRGKKARRFLRDCVRQERRFQQEKAIRQAGGGNN